MKPLKWSTNLAKEEKSQSDEKLSHYKAVYNQKSILLPNSNNKYDNNSITNGEKPQAYEVMSLSNDKHKNDGCSNTNFYGQVKKLTHTLSKKSNRRQYTADDYVPMSVPSSTSNSSSEQDVKMVRHKTKKKPMPSPRERKTNEPPKPNPKPKYS